MQEKEEKHIEYAAKIVMTLKELFNEENEFHISTDELKEGDNGKHFFMALAASVPKFYYNQFVDKEASILDVNYMANSLIFQHAKRSNTKPTEDGPVK